MIKFIVGSIIINNFMRKKIQYKEMQAVDLLEIKVRLMDLYFHVFMSYFCLGPIRAPAHLRVSVRWDYQPDICKDYKETGV